MIYDIFYLGTNVMDSGIMRLDAVISCLKPHELAVATNTNWDRHVYYAWEGEWLDAKDLPERASLAYRVGPAWNRREAERLDREGTVTCSGGYHSTAQATAAYAAAPADWRAEAEVARKAYIAAERKRTEAQALRAR